MTLCRMFDLFHFFTVLQTSRWNWTYRTQHRSEFLGAHDKAGNAPHVESCQTRLCLVAYFRGAYNFRRYQSIIPNNIWFEFLAFFFISGFSVFVFVELQRKVRELSSNLVLPKLWRRVNPRMWKTNSRILKKSWKSQNSKKKSIDMFSDLINFSIFLSTKSNNYYFSFFRSAAAYPSPPEQKCRTPSCCGGWWSNSCKSRSRIAWCKFANLEFQKRGFCIKVCQISISMLYYFTFFTPVANQEVEVNRAGDSGKGKGKGEGGKGEGKGNKKTYKTKHGVRIFNNFNTKSRLSNFSLASFGVFYFCIFWFHVFFCFGGKGAGEGKGGRGVDAAAQGKGESRGRGGKGRGSGTGGQSRGKGGRGSSNRN